LIDPSAELLQLSRRLLDAIDQQDWNTYTELCDESLTAFEPEALGQLVIGLEFHRFYLERPATGPARQSTISAPHVRVMGDAAVVSYVRLVQGIDEERRFMTTACEETRVWQRQNGRWRHVHFHRSKCGDTRP
jgi:calcium/calmodulin-dependent protein kinase (CaM kinase) II